MCKGYEGIACLYPLFYKAVGFGVLLIYEPNTDKNSKRQEYSGIKFGTKQSGQLLE